MGQTPLTHLLLHSRLMRPALDEATADARMWFWRTDTAWADAAGTPA